MRTRQPVRKWPGWTPIALERWLADLERIELGVGLVVTPASLGSEAYTLREHIDLVRRAVRAKLA